MGNCQVDELIFFFFIELICLGSEERGRPTGEGMPADHVHHLDAEKSRHRCRTPDR